MAGAYLFPLTVGGECNRKRLPISRLNAAESDSIREAHGPLSLAPGPPQMKRSFYALRLLLLS
jgi:hypothetical protein